MEGDVRGMNRRFGKAVRVPRPFGIWAFFVESYEYITWMDDTAQDPSRWDGIAST
ncbi:hypothetical protein ARMSODRAFT_952593 [Armillaria solidipes]|uniref:Uncharacterized protein n=1 Tax=Armillaria solidipes TaxID=1076256 RepID=A0A2H3BX06_9AGAR|nr:hypothetical protein ARMSODRAFT_952593 [Armillaria solidipes]